MLLVESSGRCVQHLLHEKTQVLPVDELELQAHWARYLCVIVSGFLETCVRHIFSEHARARSSVTVQRFVERKLQDFQNAKIGNITDLAGAFSSEWKEKLESFVAGEREDAVNSIVSNRHNIVHGRSVGVTVPNVRLWFQRCDEVVNFLAQLCD